MTEPRSTSVTVPTDGVTLAGDLVVPREPGGIIIFAHGSGSGRLSPRNRMVARALVDDGFATLLFDLLTRDEEHVERYTRHLRFNIGLLSSRLVDAIEWVKAQRALEMLPIGLFGASTGAAAALIAATYTVVGTVVSRGGRPDLAGDALARVRCPTLLIVGGADLDVLALNRLAMREMTAPTTLHVVPGATHLFEEPGALANVTRAAASWFRQHLTSSDWREQHTAPHTM